MSGLDHVYRPQVHMRVGNFTAHRFNRHNAGICPHHVREVANDIVPNTTELERDTYISHVKNIKALDLMPPSGAGGSYRSTDVIEALESMLPQANSSEESCIVLLDWFSGHLDDEVAACIKRKGHVLLLHGGGTTPTVQINDTNLHAHFKHLYDKERQRDLRPAA